MKLRNIFKMMAVASAAIMVIAFAGCGEKPPSPSDGRHKGTLREGYVKEYDGYKSTVRWSKNGDKEIYGLLYTPSDFDENKKYPVVIMSHGFNANTSGYDNYVGGFTAMGVVCYAFDFCGGGRISNSDGKSADMSIMTEKADLECVIDYISTQSYTDTNKIVIMGTSQGGVVTGITATANADRIAGEILCCPAVTIGDTVKDRFPSISDIPEKITVNYLEVGKNYYADIWGVDLRAEVAKYEGKALLIHGTKDSSVPYESSVKLQAMMKDARLVTVEGGEHSFTLEYVNKFMPEIESYLKEVGVL